MSEGKTNSEVDLLERLESKNWKDRQEVYSQLQEQWSRGMEPSPAIIRLLQNETNIPAMEAAIDALLAVDDLRVEDVKRIFQNIGNPKTSIKTRIEALVAHLKDTDATIEALCELLGSKSPKNVAGAISAICGVVERRDCKLEIIGDKIAGMMGHADKSVRSEGTKLCVELYKRNGESLLPYLESLKAIQQKELTEEFNKCRPIAEEEVKTISMCVPDNFYKEAEDDNWKVRLEAMLGLRRVIKNVECNSELIGILSRRMNDPNNQVFQTALEILCELRPRSLDIVRGLIERLKEKKSGITDKIKEALYCMKVKMDGSNLEFLKHKNPQVRLNLLDYSMKDLQKDEEFVRAVGKCALDPASEVRTKAVEVLHGISKKYGDVLSGVVDTAVLSRLKIVEASNKEIRTLDKKISSKDVVKTPDKATYRACNAVSKVESKKELGSEDFGLPSAEKKKEALDLFNTKYPFLAEKNWASRLEGLKSNLSVLHKEPILDLCTFLCTYKEANFHLNLCFFDLLISRGEELGEVMNLVLGYSVEHMTEAKCKNKIIELLEILKDLDRKYAVRFLWNEILRNRSGRKFIALVSLMSVVGSGEDEEIKNLLVPGCNGVSEKEAINELREKMNKIKEKPDVKKNAAIVQDKRKEDLENRIEAENSNKMANFKEMVNSKRKYSQIGVEVLLKSVSKQRNKGNGKREDVFTPQFIKMMDSGPFHQVLDMLDTIDKVVVSDIIIDFLIDSKASEASINSILLSFISSRYILRECECRKLVEYLLLNEMTEELEMMDRVYPVTKLFLIYQRVGTKEANSEILRLVKKYKMFRGDKKLFIDEIKKNKEDELEEIIKGCPDFLSFVDEIEGSFMSTAKNDCSVEEDNRLEKEPTVDVSVAAKNPSVFKVESLLPNLNSATGHDMRAPLVANDSFTIDEVDVEASFDALSINSTLGVGTPNLKKFRKEFETPVKQKAAVDGLELILDHLIDSNPAVSEVAFKRLMNVIDTNIDALLFSSNSIISSISIQLFDVLHDLSFSSLILKVFLKISQNKVFCEQLRKETLVSANSDLIKIMKRQSIKSRCSPAHLPHPTPSTQDISSLVGDILINLCLNSKPSTILEAYLEMLESSKEEILLKLIWRHSKALKMDDKEELSKILEVLTCFYDNNYTSVLAEDNVTLKILQLHLKEIVKFYREDVYGFGIRGLAKVFVGCLMDGTEIVHHPDGKS